MDGICNSPELVGLNQPVAMTVVALLVVGTGFKMALITIR